MKKVNSGTAKVVFGKRRVGKAQKSLSPKQKLTKKYRGQGR
jgi:hypothetical protein